MTAVSIFAAAGLSLIPISSALAAPARAKTGPTITHFVVAPKTFGPGGGVLHYSADLTDTQTYTLLATPAIPGLPRTLKAHPRVAGVIHIPANRSNNMHTYRLTFGTWGGVYKRVNLAVRPEPVKPKPKPAPTTTTTSVPITPPPTPAPTTTTTTAAPPPPTTTTTTTTAPPTPTLLSSAIGAVNANNPLYNGEPNGSIGNVCYSYKFEEAVCGSIAIGIQASTYPGEPTNASWLVSAHASRTFGCYLKSTATFTPVTTVSGTYTFNQAEWDFGNPAGVDADYFFGTGDIPPYGCPAGQDQVSAGIDVADVVATLVDGPFGEPGDPVLATLDVPGGFITPPFTDPYIGNEG